jgi:hypothetical protein
MDLMNEDLNDDMIRKAVASAYNPPPAVPREDMWLAIQAARENNVRPLHSIAGGASRTAQSEYSTPRRFNTKFAWIGMAAAASLLVATGVGIGRWTSQGAAPQNQLPSERPIAVIAEAPPPVPTGTSDEIGAPARPETSEPDAPSVGVSREPHARTQAEIRRNPVVVGRGVATPISGRAYASSNPIARSYDANSATPGIYQVATVRHLEDAEALLTSFQLGSRDERMNAQFSGWAKGLLSNTRLLLDSPAGDDPRRAKLLQDLELVLAQIVQLSPNAAAEDRELIQGSIQEGQVMTRLRTAIPAGSSRDILEKE